MRIFLLFMGSLIIFSQKAYPATQCGTPVPLKYQIERADVVFEGIAIESISNEAEARAANIGVDTFRPTIFSVTKTWKGVQLGEEVTIYRQIYWGDFFIQGEKYLVIAKHDPTRVSEVESFFTSFNPKVYTAEICGSSKPLRYAQEDLQGLEDHRRLTIESSESATDQILNIFR